MKDTHTCSLHAIPMSPCVVFLDDLNVIVVVPTKKTEIIPNAGNSYLFSFFSFLFPFPIFVALNFFSGDHGCVILGIL